jgi:hypothetical protein
MENGAKQRFLFPADFRRVTQISAEFFFSPLQNGEGQGEEKIIMFIS